MDVPLDKRTKEWLDEVTRSTGVDTANPGQAVYIANCLASFYPIVFAPTLYPVLLPSSFAFSGLHFSFHEALCLSYISSLADAMVWTKTVQKRDDKGIGV